MKRLALLPIVIASTLSNCGPEGSLSPGISSDVLQDSSGAITLKNPPVAPTNRKILRDEGFLSVTDDSGNLIRIEVLRIGDTTYAESRIRGGDAGLLAFNFDRKYFPLTYGTVPAKTETERHLTERDGKKLLFVAIELPGGSVCVDNGNRLDATRVVCSYLAPPFNVYITTEINKFCNISSVEAAQEQLIFILRNTEIAVPPGL